MGLQRAKQISNLIVFCALVLTLALYWPGLSGGFIFDDGNSITNNKDIQIDRLDPELIYAAAYSRDTGPLKRPISMASFAINHALSGLDAFYFKLTNVVIHLCCGLLIFIFLRKVFTYGIGSGNELIKSYSDANFYIPAMVASAWLLHPLNLTSVLYVVQRMNSLSALFVLMGIVAYCYSRERLIRGKFIGIPLIIMSLLIPGALAIFSKENGALLPVFLFIIECCVYRFVTNKKSHKYFLFTFFSVIVVAPGIVIGLVLLIDPVIIVGNYSSRMFTLHERLLTESRILFFYLQQIFIPVPSTMGLFHDGYTMSRGILDPVSTLVSIIGHIILITLGLLSLKKWPVISFGIFWFYVGHGMESTVFPLEPVYEHRNYLAIIGPLLLFFIVINKIFTYSKSKAWMMSGLALSLLSLSLVTRSMEWSSPVRHVLSEVKHHPESSRANDYAGFAYENAYLRTKNDDNRKIATEYYWNAVKLDPNMIESLISLLSIERDDNKDEVVNELKSRLANAKSHSSWFSALERLIENQDDTVNKESILLSFLSNPRSQGKRGQAMIYNLLAMNADKNNDVDAAGEYILRSIELAPNNVLYLLGYANWLGSTDNFNKSIEILERASRLPMRMNMKIRINEKLVEMKSKVDESVDSKNINQAG